MAGLPRNVTIALWTLVAGIALGAHQLWFGLIGCGLHYAGAAVCRRDPQFFDVVGRSLRHGRRRLDP